MSSPYSSPLAALSMIATDSLEGRDPSLMVTTYSSPSPLPPPSNMDNNTIVSTDTNSSPRKRKCSETDTEINSIVADRHLSARGCPPFRSSASPVLTHSPNSLLTSRPISTISDSWPSTSPLPMDGPHDSTSHTFHYSHHSHSHHSHHSHSHSHPPPHLYHHSKQLQDTNPYPSPQLPPILPAPQALRHHSFNQYRHHADTYPPLTHSSHSPHILAPIRNSPSLEVSSRFPHLHASQELLPPTTLVSPSPSSTSAGSPLAIPVSMRKSIHSTGSIRSRRSSISPIPSSPGQDSTTGNESPFYNDSKGATFRSSTPNSIYLTPSEKRRRRLERNRLAARECRQKKKFYVQELEERVGQAEAENQRLRKEIEELNAKLTLGSMHLDRRNNQVASLATAASVPFGGAAPTPPPFAEVPVASSSA